jgi:hypothetical protein
MYEHSQHAQAATFVVIANGDFGKQIARLAQEHADFDPASRRVLRPGDALYPPTTTVTEWSRRGAAALVVGASGNVCALLDQRQAVTEAWIEDCFLRACRSILQ